MHCSQGALCQLGHEQLPALPMAGAGGLMYGSGGGRRWWWPLAPFLPGVHGGTPGRLKEPAAELSKWI